MKVFIPAFFAGLCLSHLTVAGQQFECAYPALTIDRGGLGEGNTVALHGTVALVGHPGFSSSPGSAEISRFNGGSWRTESLLCPDLESGDQFGVSVAVYEDTAVVCKVGWGEDNYGSAYVYQYDGIGWAFVQKLIASDVDPGNIIEFGRSVAIWKDVIVVGSPSPGGSGKVYIYRRHGSVWDEEQLIYRNGTSFGRAVDVYENTLVATSIGTGGGAAFVYRFNGAFWDQVGSLTPANPHAANNFFGSSASIYGDYIFVDAPGFSVSTAYVYKAPQWSLDQILVDPDNLSLPANQQGLEVDAYLAAAIRRDGIYLYELIAGSWIYAQKIPLLDEACPYFVGVSVSNSGVMVADCDSIVVAPYCRGSCCNQETNFCLPFTMARDCVGLSEIWGKGITCADMDCVCTPNCAGASCGTDFCGGSCGTCDDGDICNGGESCLPERTCLPGSLVNCDDGINCTVDSCNEPDGTCTHSANNAACNDGNVCNGVETCDPASGCYTGNPVSCNDGNVCNGLETCDPASGCHTGNPVSCDDGLFCNGIEGCEPHIGCIAGTPPCDGENEHCDEVLDHCVPNQIPTMGEWGLMVVAILLLIMAKVVFGRGRVTHSR